MPQFRVHSMGTDPEIEQYDLDSGDLDGDGRLDILVTARDAGELYEKIWFNRNSGGDPPVFSKHLIFDPDDELYN